MADFEEIKTSQDAINWIKRYFSEKDEVILKAIAYLQRNDLTLSNKSYRYSKNKALIHIYFGLYHHVTYNEIGTGFQYSPSIKS
uniref:Uncharacterized protein n=1 Tax=Marseillevirus LCMAC101 TaxID=2506602 RepID=A0A481YT43_9VIRU|nr:MAG: hypothetical protein LCMAC101_02590 [Marseillevirus LCMAC101]